MTEERLVVELGELAGLETRLHEIERKGEQLHRRLDTSRELCERIRQSRSVVARSWQVLADLIARLRAGSDPPPPASPAARALSAARAARRS